ncbi:MAG: prephenate dehydrogenase/arogenate dehydrogenase family protein [Candidatus Dormibacteria bacterium]
MGQRGGGGRRLTDAGAAAPVSCRLAGPSRRCLVVPSQRPPSPGDGAAASSQVPAPVRTASIAGYGRFGRLWAMLLREGGVAVRVVEADEKAAAAARSAGLAVVDADAALDAEVIFYAVPISALAAAVRDHAGRLEARARTPLFVDLLSVKVHPRDVFTRELPANAAAMLLHPMFGPDSVAVAGLAGQPLVVDRFRAPHPVAEAWVAWFTSRGLRVVEMDADEHDRLAAGSQGVTHVVGRMLERFGFAPTPIDSLGTSTLHRIAAQVTNDTEQLFVDLQTYNPHTAAMRARLEAAHLDVVDRILPDRIHPDRLVVGIQGGRGSFNEEAARRRLSGSPDAYELVHLHTTDAVLQALAEGRVDRGQFAIHNSAGGMVGESVAAMAHHRFEIVEEFSIPIAHALMTVRGVPLEAVDTVMTHPQVIAQCRSTLQLRHPRLKLTSGAGDLIDHARVAEELAAGRLPGNVATMGSRVLAEMHGLDVVDDNLQDLDDNLTAFLWVRRPSSAQGGVTPSRPRISAANSGSDRL